MTDSKFAETTKAVGKLFGTAAQLAQKQAALATINNVTLPKLYYAIGKRIVGLETLPPELVHHREKIRALEAGINTKLEELPTAPAEGFAAKAKHLAQQAAQKASKATADAAATMQIQAAYVSLGKEAVEKFGEKAIPQELQGEFAEAKKRRALLETEVVSLRGSGRRRIVLPSRLGLVAIALYGVCWILPASGVGMFSLSGWEAFRAGLNGGVLFKAAALTNVIACASIAVLLGWHGRSRRVKRFLQVMLAISVLWNAAFLFGSIGVGYVAWMAAFVCLFVSLGSLSLPVCDEASESVSTNPSREVFAVGKVMATAAVCTICLNSAVGFFSATPDSVGNADAPAVASQPVPTREDKPDPDSGSRVDAAQMFMNAFITAAALRHAEEERLRQQQAFQQMPQPQMRMPRDLSSGMAPPVRPNGGAAGQSQPRFQMFEGTCTQCGYRTGRQVNQTQRKCIQLGVGADPTRPCGGVIVWAPVQ